MIVIDVIYLLVFSSGVFLLAVTKLSLLTELKYRLVLQVWLG